MVSRETEECNYLYQRENAGKDGRDDRENKRCHHHAPEQQKTAEFESDLKFLPPGPRDSAPDGKPAGNKPGNGGEEGEGGVAGHQELGQVDQESHGATEDVADTQPSGFNAILHF